MSKASLQTYLRTHRKRAGLSQREVAMLIAAVSGATVSRHEGARRRLSLTDAFTYEALFGVSPSALFPGEYARARAFIEARALGLLKRLADSGKDTASTIQKRRFLEELVRRVRSN
jgi:transcriptional regulator with XRE-family HTH domain